MGCRTNWAVSAALLASASIGAALGAGCSAPDPQEIPVHNPRTGEARYPDASVIGVIPTGAPGTGAFKDAPPYTAGTAQTSSVHAKHATTVIGKEDPFEQSCIECHSGQGQAALEGKVFVAAGSVRVNKNTATGAGPGIEVRILAPDGKAESAYTDQAGNWFMRTFAGGTEIPASSIIGLRKDANQQLMTTLVTGVTGAGCMQAGLCHKGTQGPVYLAP